MKKGYLILKIIAFLIMGIAVFGIVLNIALKNQSLIEGGIIWLLIGFGLYYFVSKKQKKNIKP